MFFNNKKQAGNNSVAQKKGGGFTTANERQNGTNLSFFSSAAGENPFTKREQGFTTTSEEDDERMRSSSPSAVGAKSRSGFTILYAVVVVSVVLSLGVTIEGIFQRQSQLVGSSQESSEAFYAADTGLECALFQDWNNNAFTGTSPGSVTCAGDTANISESGGTYTFQLDDTAGADACTRVVVEKTDSGTRTNTQIEARGYSTCGQSQRQAERALRSAYTKEDPEYAEARREMSAIEGIVIEARDNVSQDLMDITNDGCTECDYCRDDPTSDACINDWNATLEDIYNAANEDTTTLSEYTTNPWGGAYLLDENEGEFSDNPCRRDRLSSYGEDHTSGGDDDIRINFPFGHTCD